MPAPLPAAARERLAARARLMSRRVVAATLAAFALAWGVIAFDGSMGAATTTASTTAQPADTSSTDTSTTDTSASETGDGSTADAGDDAVTTSQS